MSSGLNFLSEEDAGPAKSHNLTRQESVKKFGEEATKEMRVITDMSKFGSAMFWSFVRQLRDPNKQGAILEAAGIDLSTGGQGDISAYVKCLEDIILGQSMVAANAFGKPRRRRSTSVRRKRRRSTSKKRKRRNSRSRQCKR